MKTALITTTINVPKVLALYKKLGPDVMMFVAGDEKTPPEVREFCDSMECVHFDDVERQKELDYKCSELLGWNNDSRRNIALLEAVKYGADIIVSIDDDMIPLGLNFFERFEIMLSEPYSGLQVGQLTNWLDTGFQTIPPFPQRGLPEEGTFHGYDFALDVQIGAMQGIILGTPDSNAKKLGRDGRGVHSATDILAHGFVVNPLADAVFNSQITAFRRELAPCFAQFYKWQKRNTDIFASLIMRRVMREHGLYTFFGPPYGFHNRSLRDHGKDHEAELWGLAHVEGFSHWLDGYVFEPGIDSVIDQTRDLYRDLEHCAWWPKGCSEAALAFLDDMESVL